MENVTANIIWIAMGEKQNANCLSKLKHTYGGKKYFFDEVSFDQTIVVDEKRRFIFDEKTPLSFGILLLLLL